MEQRPVEPKLTSYLYSKASRLRIPLSGTFELSPVCNFACRMCYVRKTQAEVKASERPMITLEQWLAIAEAAREQGMLYLLLTGGEPLLWPDFWQLYERLCAMGFLISINTNGSLIDEKAVERFRKNPPVRINITLYGAGDETYFALCGAKHVFSRVDRAISLLREAGIPVKLNGSLTPQNIHDLPAMVRYAEERGLIYEPVTYMFPPVRRDETMVGRNERFTPWEAAWYREQAFRLQNGEDMYRKRVRAIAKGTVPPPGLDENCVDPVDGKVRCRAGSASFWITWDGWITPCGMMTSPKIDMTGRSFDDCWQELTQITSALRLSGVCAKCRDREICHACAAMAITETGSSEGIPKYLCETAEAMRSIALAELEKNGESI